ncbi:MAG: type I 3-dehydroquinate dehydratase [Planctomycetota bacterium]
MALVVSILAGDLPTLGERVRRQAPLADLVEVRLDRLGHPGRKALAALVALSPRPLVVAAHGPEAFGTWSGSQEDRLALLRDAAAAGAAYVDVDWTLAPALGALRAPCRRIVSRHAGPAGSGELDRLFGELEAALLPGDVAKLVPWAERAEDGLSFLAWLRRHPGLAGFCSGEAGRFTRVLALCFGSPLSYAAPAGGGDGGATAPGQIPIDELAALLPAGGPSSRTRIFGVVGNPIGHSLSPRVHGALLRAAGIDAVYVAFRPDDFDRFLDLVEAEEAIRGLSVTVPFKARAAARAKWRAPGVADTGAANTLVRQEGGWAAHNTDLTAVGEVLAAVLHSHGERTGRPLTPQNARTLVLGAGGAARAVLGAIRARGGTATVTGIPEDEAFALAAELGVQAVPWAEIPRVDYDVLVHVTPLGMHPRNEECAVPADWIRPDRIVLDAVYRPRKTRLLAHAEARGCTCVPGAEWFVRQAAAQFRLFTGVDADEELLRRTFAAGVEAS